MINFPDMPGDSWEIPGDNHSAFVVKEGRVSSLRMLKDALFDWYTPYFL